MLNVKFKLTQNLKFLNKVFRNMPSINEEYSKKIKEFPHEPLEFTEISIEDSIRNSKKFYKQMNRRRSVRFFSDRDVPEELINQLILTAGTAPSGAHKEPWTFAVIKSPEIKKKIRDAAEKEEIKNYSGRMSEEWLQDLAPLGTFWEKPFLETAPYLIVVFRQKYRLNADGTTGKHYYTTESVGIASGILISAIHNAGLVTLTHTPSPMGFLANVLERPKNESAFVLLPIGYPAENATVPVLNRKKLEDIMKVY
jgi:nitroreductase